MNDELQQVRADIIEKKKQIEILKKKQSWTKYVKGGLGWGILGTIVFYGIEMAVFPFMGFISATTGFGILVGQALAIGVGRYFWKTRKERRILRKTDAKTLEQEISQLNQREKELTPQKGQPTVARNMQTPPRQVSPTTPRQVGPTTRPRRNYNQSQTQPSNPYAFRFNPNQPQNNDPQQNENKPKTR